MSKKENSRDLEDFETNGEIPIKGKKNSNILKVLIPVFIIIGVIILLIVGKGLFMDNTPNEPVVETPVIEEPIEEIPDIVEPSEVEESIDVEEPIEKFGYENDMLGIKFNFDSNLYIKENVEEIFNTIKVVIPEDRDVFNIYSDKLNSILNVVKLTTGDSDGLYISVSILPFEIEKETTTLKIDGSTEVKNESIEAINLTDAELIEKYDTQIKETLAQSKCELISYDKSSVLNVGSQKVDEKSKLKGIFTSRVYSGPIEVTTSTGVVDVLQCTIPVGKNAILITAVTDGRPIEIDKSAIFKQIVDSLIVVTDGPIIEDIVTDNIESEG